MPTTLQQPPSLRCVAVLSFALLAACEGPPPRSKPWRHRQPADLGPMQSSLAIEAERDALADLSQRNSTLRIHMDSDPRHLNPLIEPSVWGTRIAMDTVFETLIRFVPPDDGDLAGAGRYEPGLARSWRVAGNGRTIWIDLEEDVLFHDGRRMSAVDVQFAIDAARNYRVDAPHLRRQLEDIDSVEITSQTSLRIRLNRVNGYVLRALAQVPILPAHVYGKHLRRGRGPVVGTGPYRLANREDDVIRLERNPAYWGQPVQVEAIEFVHERDAAEALNAAKRNLLDIVPSLIAAHYPAQADSPAIASRFVPLRLRPPVTRFIVVGQRQPPLEDVRLRAAIAHVIDRDRLVTSVYGGLARPAGGVIWPGGPGHGPAMAAPAHDLQTAGRLLEAAGWRDTDGDGIRERAGKRLQVVFLALAGGGAERDHIVDALRHAGFFVEVRRGSAGVLDYRLRRGEFDLALVEWRAAVDTEMTGMFATGGYDNLGRFSDPRVDAVLGQLRAAPSPEARRPLMDVLARQLAESWPVIPTTAPEPQGLLHRRVRGVRVWNGWIALRDVSLADD
jgi:peptide/nickel transport system substrate-binding protein